MRRYLVMAIAAAGLLAVVPAAAQSDCAGGVIYDDGTIENAYSPNRITGTAGNIVMRFDFGGTGGTVRDVCVCWARADSDSNVAYSVVFYDDDGGGGQPGTRLGAVNTQASGIPFGLPGQFYRTDVSSAGIPAVGSIYVGVEFNAPANDGIFVCADETGSEEQPGYISNNGGASWTSLFTATDGSYRAMGIRARTQGGGTGEVCIEDDHTICLLNGRFQVEVDFTPPNGTTQPANAIPFTDRAGMFWFFNENNVEMLVKMQNACVEPFNRFWVFFAATTNVQFEVRVTDTEAGLTNFYDNPQGMVALPVADTEAFATCP